MFKRVKGLGSSISHQRLLQDRGLLNLTLICYKYRGVVKQDLRNPR